MCMRYECDLDHKDLGREAETILVCSIRALLVFARVQVYCTCILYSRNLCLCTRCALPCQDTQHVVCALPCQDTRPTMSRHTPTPYHVKTHNMLCVPYHVKTHANALPCQDTRHCTLYHVKTHNIAQKGGIQVENKTCML